MASLSGQVNYQELSDLGILAAGFRLYTYLPGTTTHTNIYTDAAGAVPHTYTNDGAGGQYIGLDARGEVPGSIYVANGGVDLALKTVAGATVWTRRAIGQADAATAIDTSIRADIASTSSASLGDFLVGVKRTATGAVATTQHNVNERNALNLRADFGAVGDGVANDTAAVQAWMNQMDTHTLYAPAGTYLVDEITITSTGLRNKLYGDGRGITIFKSRTTNNDVFKFAAATPLQMFELEGFEINGFGSGTGNGIHIPTGMTFPPYNLILRNLYIHDCGNAGVLDSMGAFTLKLDNVITSDNKGHQFDLLGSNTVQFNQCYAQAVPTTGKAGYRVHSGTATFYSCNGINSGEYWGIFGDTTAEDGSDHFCYATLIGCNVEDASVCGIRNKNNATRFIGTTILAPAAGTVKNYLCDSANNPGFCDDINLISQTKGAAFTNGFAIHTTANQPPFLVAFSSVDTSYTFYDDTGAAAHTVGCFQAGQIGFLRTAQAVGDFWVKQALQTTQFILKRKDVTYSASMTLNVETEGNEFDITATNGTAFTINAPAGTLFDGQRISVTIRNTSGGALGTATWNAAFKMSTWTQPATGFSRTIDFKYNGTNWVQAAQTGVDVPN